MTEIRWEDPPPPKRVDDWAEELTPLMAQPKRWAVVAVRKTGSAARAVHGNFVSRRVKVPPGEWEFARRMVDGEHRVYARYLGPDEDGTS
jgi:hypothetical protein